MIRPARAAGSERALRRAAAQEPIVYHRILVPIDGSPTAERGLREAIALAAEQKARLYLLNVVDDYPIVVQMSSATRFEQTERARMRMSSLLEFGEALLNKAQRTATDAGVPADTLLREGTHGRVADVIVEEAAKAGCDLIVMGTHGRRGFSRLMMGSDAELVVRTSPVPVLLVRQEDPKT
jgi:nucleotide-binding universal stress UspA family protein